ncbi:MULTISPECIES: hypothetical protein [unclassified Paenibacillus]|uniref:hypothetical protein n=1 Tax=unclassified Paenibacillus TaxID=185978 RepID=UPI002404FFAC|nr:MULTISPECIES: hypothetical protein [unclassified Paenibacillus]MDF9840328.1 hypothetical protein [Paenibacillus sp. PastF-2]MDF9846910.1 hypothetical protein [Paenibacillus sp. PastM-2]MDF9853482.1 hypothetical protein [Paenibacillus sp. PastF-1]MDH6479031.1 hypothetical protein [Paenibacillus sp. PastH-2]MDH6506763.1 hypothetical protein [Paenibacillus sp. PastM-3]
MNRGWLIGMVLLVTAATAVILPQMATLEAALPQHAVETLGGDGTILADENIVDTLSSLPLSLDIGSAGWKNGVLSLDLKVTGNDHEPEELYRNMALAVSFAFQETDNVDQLLLRIVAEDKWLDSRRLLLAGDIRRTEWSLPLQELLENTGNRPLPDVLKEGFRISESELWRKQFIYP